MSEKCDIDASSIMDPLVDPKHQGYYKSPSTRRLRPFKAMNRYMTRIVKKIRNPSRPRDSRRFSYINPGFTLVSGATKSFKRRSVFIA
jgi:hypothetical protein